ncbi:hotdog fold domain-containing protein [Pseudoalteromonas luteoviolacea]|uniref:DUF4442 domain-containing protein n=1 Tax=Pseudoalteromonas luteoviolacea NCIMB 1942 TaxID=1365253 RepID=A0A167HDH7_9GAMM|nr:hotdog fold domain-containing protein [Pseudoalteromonas luteoviolacea]KZN58001.1 hypothetical protein N482_22720 [Pseudoalteromonas luteoviolacea NCIMB 1942]KZW99953.1 hypothetical protein JL49_14395 [Pseudoalteromonas luteoviolacea]
MASSLLKTYKKFKWLPFGNWLFSKAICKRAPYFATIKPKVTHLSCGRICAEMPNRRAVHNHIGTVHAIAQCNLAELCAGVVTDATVPNHTHRWIPKGMTVQYLKKADSDLKAQAQIPMPREWKDKEDLIVPVEVFNNEGVKVFHADITMYITEKS